MITGNHMTSVFEVRLCQGAASRLEAVFDDEDLAREAARKIEMRTRGGRVVVQPAAGLPQSTPDEMPVIAPPLPREPAAQLPVRSLLMFAVLACSSIFLL